MTTRMEDLSPEFIEKVKNYWSKREELLDELACRESAVQSLVRRTEEHVNELVNSDVFDLKLLVGGKFDVDTCDDVIYAAQRSMTNAKNYKRRLIRLTKKTKEVAKLIRELETMKTSYEKLLNKHGLDWNDSNVEGDVWALIRNYNLCDD